MVADLVAVFDDPDTKHDNIHSSDSDTPVSDIDDTITDASRDPIEAPSFVDVVAAFDDHGKNDSDGTSRDNVLNDTDMSIEIAAADDQYHDETHMIQALTICSPPHDCSLPAVSYNDALTAWRRHVTTPFPLIIQPDTIVCTPRSHEVRPTHVLGYNIDAIQGDGNCFFWAISKEIFATEVNHPHLRLAIVNHVDTSDDLRSSLYAVSPFNDEHSFDNDVVEMRNDGTWASTWVIFVTATFLQTPIDTYTLVGREWAWCTHNPFPPTVAQPIRTTSMPHTIRLVHTNQNHYNRTVPEGVFPPTAHP